MKTLRTAGMVVAAVALVATTAGMAAPAIAGVTAGGVAGVSAATLGAIGAYGGLAAGALSAITAAAAPKGSAQGSATSFTTNPQSGLPYAIGRTRMSGLRIYAETNTRAGYTKFNDLLWFGALLSIGGQIDSIEKFTADNEVVTFDGNGNAIGTYHDYQAQRVHLGGPQASALSLSLMGGSPPGWTSAHRLPGVTHALWCLRFNKEGEMYGAGAPEPAWIGKWVRVYDPRLDSTYPGGSGPCRALQEDTYVWSDNPGLHALTWVLGRWENGKRTCGVGSPIANIRVSEFVECANVCDANSWKAGGVEWTTDGKWDPLKRMLQAGGAIPTQTGAMIGCLVSAPRTAIATIESRHLLDGLNFASTKSRRDRFNTVIPRYVDEDSDWSVISGTAVQETAWVTIDGGQRTKEIDFPLVQVFSGETARQPGQLAAYAIVNSREAGPWTWTTGPEWIGLKTGDVVYMNVPEEGIINQPILITRRAPDPATGKVSFSGETETFSKHAYALGQTTTPPAPFSLQAPDLKPIAPATTAFSVSGATSGEGFPALLVVGTSEMPSADSLIIDYRRSGDTVWISSAILSAVQPVSHVIAPLASETAYDVRIGYRIGTIDGNFTIFANVVTGLGKITIIEAQMTDLDAEMAQLAADTAQALLDIAAAEQTVIDMQEEVGGLADAILAAEGEIDAIEAVQATQGTSITTLQTTASTQAGEIASIETDLATANASISTNASAISGLTSSVSTLSSTVSTQGASITSLQSAITTTNGNVATLQSTVSTQGASITTMESALSTLDSDVALLSTKVASGNPNMCPNGSFEDGLAGWSANVAFGAAADGWGSYTGSNTNIANGASAILYRVIPAAANTQYTLSADIGQLIAGGTGVHFLQFEWLDAANNQLGVTPGPTRPSGVSFDITGASRQALKVTATAPTGTASVRIYVVWLKSSGTVQNFHVRQIKLERGSVATSSSQEASVTQSFASINGLLARWGVELDVNGYVSGIALNNNGARSDFIVRADKFQVISPFSGAGLTWSVDGLGRPTFRLSNGSINIFEVGWVP